MQKSTIRLFLISALTAIVLSSCARNLVGGFTPVNAKPHVYEVPYFAQPAIDYVYKANISVYGNELSGIFIAKKINESTHRVVFTTEFGNKLLDFEISQNDFKVNSIVSELDKKILINTLKTDFRLLLKREFTITETLESEEEKVLKSPDGNRDNYIFVSKSDGKVLRIMQGSKRKEKIVIGFTSQNDIFAEKITIRHKDIKLDIELNYFNQSSQTP